MTENSKALSVGTFFYSALFFTRCGLALRKTWAEYLTIISTACSSALEVYEIAKRATRRGSVVLLANIASWCTGDRGSQDTPYATLKSGLHLTSRTCAIRFRMLLVRSTLLLLPEYRNQFHNAAAAWSTASLRLTSGFTTWRGRTKLIHTLTRNVIIERWPATIRREK